MKHWKSLTKKRPNKEDTIQFNIPRGTLSTWNQPISTILFCIDCFWIFWTTYRSNYRRGWWKWRWWTNCTPLKKWSWQDNQNFKQIKSVHKGFKFDPLISKPTRIINQWRDKWGYHEWAVSLTLWFPMYPFSAPWKQKTVKFSDVFRG